MRNLVLGLLLANLMVLAWSRWIQPAEVENPASLGPATEAQLVLYRTSRPATEWDGPRGIAVEEGVAVAARDPSDDEESDEAVAASALQCERIGPFVSAETAVSIGEQLGSRGMTVDLVSEPGSVWVGHWVQVMNLESEATARDAVRQLVDAGLVDAYIVQSEPTYNISLGVFRSREGADRVTRIANSIGMIPVRMDRYRSGIEHWVNVRLEPPQTLDLTDLVLERSQILRTERVDCRAAANADGESEGDPLESGAEVA